MSEVTAPNPRPSPRSSRVPPHDLHAEESLLGAMMLETEAIATAAGVLRAADFYKPANAHIFDAVHALYASGQPVDAVTVGDELKRNGLLDAVGGHQALVDIMASTPATSNAAGYARIIEEHALLRRLIGVAGEIAEMGYSMPDDITKALDRAESMVYDVNQRRVTDTTSKIEDLLGLNLDRLEHLYGRGDAITGTPTGYMDLDELLSGLQPSTLVIVGARPSMGKCVAWDTPIVDPATGAVRTAAELHAAGEAGEDVAVLALAGGPTGHAEPADAADPAGPGPQAAPAGHAEPADAADPAGPGPQAAPAGHAEPAASGGEADVAGARDVAGAPDVASHPGPGGPGGPRLVTVRPSAYVDDGRKPVFRVRTASGRQVRTTASHPFLTPGGWRPLAELAVGQQVGVPAALPCFGRDVLPTDEVLMLAHLVGAPGSDKRGPRLWTDNREVATDIEHRGARWGVSVGDRLLPGGARTWDVECGDGLHALAAEHGVAAEPADRRVPPAVFRLTRDLLARFLNRLLGSTATVWQPSPDEPGGLVVTVRSEGLAADLHHLLLRFGVAAVRREAVVAVDEATWVAHELVVEQPSAVLALAEEVGVLGQEAALGTLASAARRAERAADERVLIGPNGAGEARGPAPGTSGTSGTSGPSRPRGRPRPATVLWDEVVAIEPEGDEQVYDLTVPEWHNFVAADVFVHNTSFALGMAAHAALHASKPVLVFSLEMGSLELSQRLLCGEARIDSSKVRTGRLAEDDWSRISQAIGRLAQAPIWIDDNPNLTVMEIRAKARRLKSQVGDLGMVVIDYLQLMTGRGSAENRQVEVSEISRGLKILARELECPVVALSQLSRQLELRADKRPMLADLRESGSIEQDADVVMFIYRDDVYHEDSPDRGQAEIIVSKHRNGPTGVCRLAFLQEFTRFANMARIE
jgi:replicative DNA helicase